SKKTEISLRKVLLMVIASVFFLCVSPCPLCFNVFCVLAFLPLNLDANTCYSRNSQYVTEPCIDPQYRYPSYNLTSKDSHTYESWNRNEGDANQESSDTHCRGRERPAAVRRLSRPV